MASLAFSADFIFSRLHGSLQHLSYLLEFSHSANTYHLLRLRLWRIAGKMNLRGIPNAKTKRWHRATCRDEPCRGPSRLLANVKLRLPKETIASAKERGRNMCSIFSYMSIVQSRPRLWTAVENQRIIIETLWTPSALHPPEPPTPDLFQQPFQCIVYFVSAAC